MSSPKKFRTSLCVSTIQLLEGLKKIAPLSSTKAKFFCDSSDRLYYKTSSTMYMFIMLRCFLRIFFRVWICTERNVVGAKIILHNHGSIISKRILSQHWACIVCLGKILLSNANDEQRHVIGADFSTRCLQTEFFLKISFNMPKESFAFFFHRILLTQLKKFRFLLFVARILCGLVAFCHENNFRTSKVAGGNMMKSAQ